MSKHNTYIYRMDMGSAGKVLQSVFLYAYNAAEAKKYCKETFAPKHYDYFRAIKIGELKTLLKDPAVPFNQNEIDAIRTTPAKDGDHFAEHRYGVPRI